jgi:hypothetical protein
MKKMISLGLALIGAFVVVNSVEAEQCHKGRINSRQHQQGVRIRQGVRSGALNGRETARLARQEAKLARTEAHMRRTGDGLSGKEKVILEHKQDHLSHDIYREKHDAQHRN